MARCESPIFLSSTLELVRRKCHDVALLESDLPDIDGIELFQRIKRRRTQPPVRQGVRYARASEPDGRLVVGCVSVAAG